MARNPYVTVHGRCSDTMQGAYPGVFGCALWGRISMVWKFDTFPTTECCGTAEVASFPVPYVGLDNTDIVLDFIKTAYLSMWLGKWKESAGWDGKMGHEQLLAQVNATKPTVFKLHHFCLGPLEQLYVLEVLDPVEFCKWRAS